MSRIDSAMIALGGNAMVDSSSVDSVNIGNIHGFDPSVLESVAREVAGIAQENPGSIKAMGHGNGLAFGVKLDDYALRRIKMLAAAIIRETQQEIGNSILSTFDGVQLPAGLNITRVLVDPDDPDLHNPVKGVGSWTREKAHFESNRIPYVINPKDSGLFRRAVASPRPVGIHLDDLDQIKQGMEDGKLMIAGGGGGSPLIQKDLVFDKDAVASMIARETGLAALVIITNVPGVYESIEALRNGGRPIENMDLAMAREMAMGPNDGAMVPKIRAALEFAELDAGRMSIITDLAHFRDVMAGRFDGVTKLQAANLTAV